MNKFKGKIAAPTKPEPKKEKTLNDFVTPHLTIEEIRDIKTAFDIFDSDGSGVVDPL